MNALEIPATPLWTCGETARRRSELEADSLSDSEALLLREHVSACPACAVQLDSMPVLAIDRPAVRALGRLETATRSRIEGRRIRRPLMAVAASLAVMGIAAYLTWSRSLPDFEVVAMLPDGALLRSHDLSALPPQSRVWLERLDAPAGRHVRVLGVSSRGEVLRLDGERRGLPTGDRYPPPGMEWPAGAADDPVAVFVIAFADGSDLSPDLVAQARGLAASAVSTQERGGGADPGMNTRAAIDAVASVLASHGRVRTVLLDR